GETDGPPQVTRGGRGNQSTARTGGRGGRRGQATHGRGVEVARMGPGVGVFNTAHGNGGAGPERTWSAGLTRRPRYRSVAVEHRERHPRSSHRRAAAPPSGRLAHL